MGGGELDIGANALPQAILFDLYETLITEFDPSWHPTPTVGDRLGIHQETFSETWQRIWSRRMTGQIPTYRDALCQVCQQAGHNPPTRLIAQLDRERLQTKMRLFEQITPDIRELLWSLRRRGILIGLVSNAAPEEIAGWASCALAPYVHEAVFSCQVGLIKPDPEIYSLACRRLGVRPKASWFVGDGGDKELQGAERAGLEPYWATWFLNRYPAWRVSARAELGADRYPRLHTPQHLLDRLRSADEDPQELDAR